MIEDLRKLINDTNPDLSGNVMYNRVLELLKLCEVYASALDNEDTSDFTNKENVRKSIQRLIDSCKSMGDDFNSNAAWPTVDKACDIAGLIISQ